MTQPTSAFDPAAREDASPPVTTLDELEHAATQMALRVSAGTLDLRAAARRLWDIAETANLAAQHGDDRVQDRMEEGFRVADRMMSQGGDALVLTCMADIAMKPVAWLWPGRIAIGKVTELAGEGGVGKSSVLFDIAARVSRGAAWPDGAAGGPPGAVFILTTEDDPADTVKPRLHAAGADMRKIFCLPMIRESAGTQRAFDLQADLARLEQSIRRVGDVRAVIIDPITAYLGRTASSDNASVRAVLGPLGEMAAHTRVAAIGNTHFSKQQSRGANARVLGSVGFVNQARSVIVVTRDAQDRQRRLFLPSKVNLTAEEHGLAFRIEPCLVGGGDAASSGESATIAAARIVWEPTAVTITADAALAALTKKDAGEKSAKAGAIEFLAEVLGDGPKPAGEVLMLAQQAGHGRKAMTAARKALRLKPQKTGYQGEWMLGLRETASS